MIEYDGKVPDSLKKMLEKHSDKIKAVDRHDSEDGYWVYFKPGFIDMESNMHYIHEWNIPSVKERLGFIEKEKEGAWGKRVKYVKLSSGCSYKSKRKSKRTTSKVSRVR